MELTRREREVAELVADGLTNRAIAERLYISERTVEGHVEHALGKLGFDSRAQLAAWIARGGRPAAAADVVLPVQLTRFIGREAERERALALLRAQRLVTLVGPGGAGKTRLAAEVAKAGAGAGSGRFHLVRMLELAPLAESAAMPAELAAVLGVAGAADPWTAVRARLGGGSLLVLDNCEHLVAAAAEFAERLLRETGVTLLATSREPLSVPGEAVLGVGPLAPEEALELFFARAPDAQSADDVEQICERLDRLPLALELAAARTRVMSASALAGSLDRALSLLSRGSRTGPDRSRSLEASIDWSYRLLDEGERRVLRAVSAFASAVDLSALVEVADASEPLILDLVDRSLLMRTAGDRYRLLEPIRQFAAEKLSDSGERSQVEARLDAQLLALPGLTDARTAGSARELIWSRRDDIRSSLQRLRLSNLDGYCLLTAALASCSWDYGARPQASERMREVVALTRQDHPQRSFILAIAAACTIGVGFRDQGLRLLEESIEVASAAGDELNELRGRVGLAIVRGGREGPEVTLRALEQIEPLADRLAADDRTTLWNVIAMEHWKAGRPERAESYARRALKSVEHPLRRSIVCDTLALALAGQGRFEEAARELAAAASATFEAEAVAHATWHLLSFARIEVGLGNLETAALLVGAAEGTAAAHAVAVERDSWSQEPFASAVAKQPAAAARGRLLGWREALELAIKTVEADARGAG